MHSLVRRGKQLQSWHNMFIKKYTSARLKESTTKAKDKRTFDEFINGRQQQATRSIVVQVSSEKSFTELYRYCHTFGEILSAHHYRVQSDDDMHYILIEFASAQIAASVLDSSVYNEQTSVPVRSSFLWFKSTGQRLVNVAEKSDSTQKLSIVDGTHTLDEKELDTFLLSADNIEQQIKVLHQQTHLNDLGIRLRFLAAHQVQQALSGMFPAANAQPFGSSVNGFGKMGCDLDLILRFDHREAMRSPSKKQNESRLVFHTKEYLSNGRSQIQRQMESMGDMLQLFLPGVCHVRRILQARVPIIKYNQEHLNLEVDLSINNLSGFYMSELLYMFGEWDERVRPLTFCVRRWASACGLTNPSPGRWITNFSLTSLVIFFLQQLKQPVLPTIGALFAAATPSDVRLTEDGINCTFGRDIRGIGFQRRNTSQINELLLQFFEYYSQFDFNNRAISLNEGRAIGKPDHSAMYIVNPLEPVLNVSKNVSLEECERLRVEVRNAAWVLESEVESPALAESEKEKGPWGLLNLFRSPEKTIIRPNMFFRPRMMEVSELFDKADSNAESSLASEQITYKNSTVKQQVHSIKLQARTDLKRIQTAAGLATATAIEAVTKSNRRRR